MIYSIVNYDFFRRNLLPYKAMVLPELKLIETKIPILETHMDILVNNVLSRRNDHLEPSGKNSSQIIGRLL